MKKKILPILTALLLAACSNSEKPGDEASFTNIILQNSSSQDSVQVFVTLQSTDTVTGLFGITAPSSTVTPYKGNFWAKKKHKYYWNRKKATFGAVITFVGDNWPCDQAIQNGFKTGINCFEFTINTKYESADITCLDGVNCVMKYTVSDDSWTAGTKTKFKSTQNSITLAKNCCINGVFPYQCDHCTTSVTPPKPNCFGNIKCNKTNNCQINRAGKKGGTISLEYIGS